MTRILTRGSTLKTLISLDVLLIIVRDLQALVTYNGGLILGLSENSLWFFGLDLFQFDLRRLYIPIHDLAVNLRERGWQLVIPGDKLILHGLVAARTQFRGFRTRFLSTACRV